MTLDCSVVRDWDVVVVGAGPAGSMAAREMARRGRSVLLVEKSRFPRWKVCGACVGALGVRTLREVGLGDLLDRIGAVPVRRTRLVWRSRSLFVPMGGMVAVSRSAMDTALAGAARAAGATVLDGVRAAADPSGEVVLHDGHASRRVRSRSVVLASGLRAAGGDAGTRIDARSWIGLGATGPDEGSFGADELVMIVGSGGYVGRVRTEDGRANWAAAVDPAMVRAAGGPAAAIRSLCRDAGVDATIPASGWKGTPALTRTVPVRDGRIHRVGDASGYVEPITGEGMSWALLGGVRLAGLLHESLETKAPGATWPGVHARLFRPRRIRCRLVARSLRSPAVMRTAFALSGGGPARTRFIHGLIGAGGDA